MKNKIKTLFIISILTLLCIELVLQAAAYTVVDHNTHAKFFTKIKKDLDHINPKKTIVFIGDSFIYGLGASSLKNSVPGYFKSMLANNGDKYFCINAGYPGTSTIDHFTLLSKLPNESIVVLRTGSNNGWNLNKDYTLSTSKFNIQFRLYKLFKILKSHYFGSTVSQQEIEDKLIIQIKELAIQKKMTLVLLDYPNFETYIHSHLKKTPKFLVISNKDTFSEGLPNKFLAFDGVHLNDLGYFAEAKFLYNYFRQNNILSLSPSSSMSEVDVINGLYDKYLTLFKSIKELKISDNDMKVKMYELYKLLTIPSLAQRVGTPNFAEKIEKILMFHFYQYKLLIGKLNHYRNKEKLSKNDITEVKFLLNFMLYFPNARDSNHYNVTQEFIDHFVETIQLKAPHIEALEFDEYNFMPLEFCPKIINKTPWKQEVFEVSSVWSKYFGKELGKKEFVVPDNCN